MKSSPTPIQLSENICHLSVPLFATSKEIMTTAVVRTCSELQVNTDGNSSVNWHSSQASGDGNNLLWQRRIGIVLVNLRHANMPNRLWPIVAMALSGGPEWWTDNRGMAADQTASAGPLIRGPSPQPGDDTRIIHDEVCVLRLWTFVSSLDVRASGT